MYQKNKKTNKDILEMTQNSINSETKIFNLDSLDGIDGLERDYETMTIDELKLILDDNLINRKEKSKIKKILKKKMKNA